MIGSESENMAGFRISIAFALFSASQDEPPT